MQARQANKTMDMDYKAMTMEGDQLPRIKRTYITGTGHVIRRALDDELPRSMGAALLGMAADMAVQGRSTLAISWTHPMGMMGYMAGPGAAPEAHAADRARRGMAAALGQPAPRWAHGPAMEAHDGPDGPDGRLEPHVRLAMARAQELKSGVPVLLADASEAVQTWGLPRLRCRQPGRRRRLGVQGGQHHGGGTAAGRADCRRGRLQRQRHQGWCVGNEVCTMADSAAASEARPACLTSLPPSLLRPCSR